MALSDFFNNATVSTRPDAGALTAQKLIAAASITVDTTAGWPVSPDSVHFIIYQVDAGGNKVAGTQTDWKGTVTSSTAIGSLTLKAGTDQIYPVGSKVIATPTGAWADDMVTGLLVAHEQDGTLKAGAVDVTAVIADGVVTRAKLATAVTTELNDGWTTPTQTVSSVTNNGNRSYDVVFNSTVASVLSPGMRLRTTRTVTAPTQCADLEASSSQYFSSASAGLAGVTFTDDFVVSAWVKLESYAAGTIASRYNGTSGWGLELNASGQILMTGRNGGAGNVSYFTSYQSIPLGKWVHVAGQLDMSAFTATTTTSYLMIDGVDVPVAVARAGTNPTALIQAGDLQIGAFNAGQFFDGKIAQVAIFGAKVTQATMRTYMSQGLSGSETSLVSAFSCNNSLLDLNTTNNNDLTANGGALMTATDSPFGQDSNGVTAGTTDYELVMKVNGATATVQVPEGCTIPTSGGVSAVAYSTATSPFGFTLDKGRWKVLAKYNTRTSKASPVNATVYNNGDQFTLPVGPWGDIGYEVWLWQKTGTSGLQSPRCELNTSSAAVDTKSDLVSGLYNGASAEIGGSVKASTSVTVSAQTPYYLNLLTSFGGTTDTVGFLHDLGAGEIYAIPAGV